MKLTPAQLKKIIAEEVKLATASKQLNEYGLGALADASELTKVKSALATFVEHLKESAVAAGSTDPGDIQDTVHSALDELMEEVFSEAGFEAMPLGYYRG